MKITFLSVLLGTTLLIGQACFAANLAGNFSGKGNMFINNEGFGYEVSYRIDDKHILAHLGSAEKGYDIALQYEVDPHNRVIITVNGKPAGKGFCLVTSCHFDFAYLDISGNDTQTNMTLTLDKDRLVVTYQQDGGRIFLEDILNRAP